MHQETIQQNEILGILNEKHAVVMVGGKTAILNEDFDPSFNRKAVTFSSVADFKLRYQNRPIPQEWNAGRNIVDLWLNHSDRKQYQGIYFEPYSLMSPPTEETEDYYNLFQGWPINPVEGDCNLFWEHVEEVVCDGDDELYRYVRKWMAHAIQYPKELPEVALVLRGGQGVGKDMFARHFGELFGQHYLPVSSMDQVAGRFNGHLADVLLLQANEAAWNGNRSNEGILKGMITDPVLSLEYKGKDITRVNNYKRLIICSNESLPVPVGLDDRRFLFLDVSEKHKGNRDYFGRLIAQMKDRGFEALMWDLIHEDLDNFDVRSKPQQNLLLDIKLESGDSLLRWWYGCLYDGIIHTTAPIRHPQRWTDEKMKANIYFSYKEYCKDYETGKPFDSSKFFKKLRDFQPGIKETRPAINDKRIRCYEFPPLNQCRQNFEKKLNNQVEWPETEKEELVPRCPPLNPMVGAITN